jgi:hypothetical protein
MGHTSTTNKPLPLNNCPKQFKYSRLSRLLRRSGAKFYVRDCYLVYILKIFVVSCESIIFTCGAVVNPGLAQCNSPGFDMDMPFQPLFR